MPIDHTDRQFDPRQRIVGAIILVSLAVIFLPMILDEQPPLGSAVVGLSEIPASQPKSAPELGSSAVPAVITAAAAAPTQKTAHTADTVATNDTKVPARPEKGVYRPDAERAPAPAAASARKNNENKQAADKGWFVQVGTFSNADNARQLADRLKQNGFTARTENIQLTQGRAVRVRVGPFPGDDDAKTAQNRIEQTVGIKGVILAYQ